MKKLCLSCGNSSPAFLVICQNCGERMDSPRIKKSAGDGEEFASESKKMPAIFTFGILFMLLGVSFILGSYLMDTAAPFSDTLNIGRLQSQMMALHIGLGLFVAGSIFSGCGAVVQAIKSRD